MFNKFTAALGALDVASFCFKGYSSFFLAAYRFSIEIYSLSKETEVVEVLSGCE